MVSNWSLSGSKSLQVSRTLLRILADLNKAVVWMVSTRPVISKSSSPCTNPLAIVLRAPIIIGITVIFMFQFVCFFQFPNKVLVLILLLLSFNFTQWSAGTPKSTIQQDFFFFFFFLTITLGLVVWEKLNNPFVFQNPRRVCASHFPGRILGCAYSIYSYGQI